MSFTHFRRGNTLARDRAEHEHGHFQGRYVLVFEREVIAVLCRFRGEYFTREGWLSGEPGFKKSDLREGESIRKRKASA